MIFLDRAPSFLERLRSSFRLAALCVPMAVIGLAGCANHQRGDITGSIQKPLTTNDFRAAADYWGKRYLREPGNKQVALNYAAALGRLDRNDQAVAILQRTALQYKDDRQVMAAYGKAVAATGDLGRALEIIRRAQRPEMPDWRLMSAEAAILDQTGDHRQARKLYLQALEMAPNEPSVLSNLGMSYLLTNELAEAERVLRQAAALPNADSRVRQNLALCVGLEGRFAEAERIATAEMSPQQAAANIAYLKTMLASPDAWKKLKKKPAPSPATTTG